MTPVEQPIVEFIRERLQKTFNPSFLEVVDESEQHKGHAGYFPGGSHFAVTIVADSLAGLSRLDVHRKIYAALDGEVGGRIHALRIVLAKSS